MNKLNINYHNILNKSCRALASLHTSEVINRSEISLLVMCVVKKLRALYVRLLIPNTTKRTEIPVPRPLTL